LLVVEGHGGKDCLVVAPDHELGDGIGEAFAIGKLAAELHELFRVRIRQRLQEDFIDDAENTGVGADSKSKRRDSDDGETGILSQ
jgi:hypothetical protein